MSDVFDTCENNFLKNIRFVQKTLQQQNESNSRLDEMNESLADATQQLNKMEIQYGILQNPEMKAKIHLYKDQLRTYKKKVLESSKFAKMDKEHLSDDNMLQKEEDVGVNPLLQAKRQMYQNEALSQEAALGIKKNNQKLMKNINRVSDINANLTVAQKLLGSIKRKMSKNKYILYGTIFVLILVVIFVTYTYLA